MNVECKKVQEVQKVHVEGGRWELGKEMGWYGVRSTVDKSWQTRAVACTILTNQTPLFAIMALLLPSPHATLLPLLCNMYVRTVLKHTVLYIFA